MFTQRFIKILHSVQEIEPFSLFQNLALGKASTIDKCHFAIPWARSFQHQIVCKILSKYFKQFELIFTFFQNLNLGKTSTNPKCHLTISGLHLVNIPMCMQNFITIFHSVQEIGPFSLFSEFGARQNLDRGKMTFHNLLG